MPTVIVGSKTASSAEILTLLLRRYREAEVVGERTLSKEFLYRIIPVEHGWRLLVPEGRCITVPAAVLTSG